MRQRRYELIWRELIRLASDHADQLQLTIAPNDAPDSWKELDVVRIHPRPDDRLVPCPAKGPPAASTEDARDRAGAIVSGSATSTLPKGFEGVTAGGTRRRAGIRALLIALVAAGALTAAAMSTAAKSSETTTFGADGVALASLGPTYLETEISSVKAGTDGTFVAERSGELETFLPDGAPDPAAPPTALPKGHAVFPVAGGKSLILEDGKLRRANPDGSPDTSFGGTGTVKTQLYGPDAVAELGSGKIAEVGTTIVGARRSSGLIEITVLNPHGSIDRRVGLKPTRLPLERDVGLREIVPMADGGALVVDESFLLELRADGTANNAFGNKGFVYAGHLTSASFRPDGSIEAVGQSYGSGTGQDLAVFRFTSTGKAESAFAPEGVRRFDLGDDVEANAASWASDGSVIVAGDEYKEPCLDGGDGCETVPTVAAIDAAGNLDTGFGEGGVLRLSALAGPSANYLEHGATALTRRPDGSIVVGGNAPPEETIAFLAGVTPEGQLIPSFGEGGIVRLRTPVPAGQALAGIAALPGGGLLAAGTTELNVQETPVLIRYAVDGSLDPSFGGGTGYVVLGQPGRSPAGFAFYGEEALTSLGGSSRGHLLMYETGNGEPVSTFGSGGSVTLPEGVKVKALAFAADGDPLVLAKRAGGKSEVLRYLPDGMLEKTFGRGGKAQLRLSDGGEVDVSSLALGARGTLLIGGRSGDRFALGRFRPDGTPDRRFGSGGWTLVSGGDPAEYEFATPNRDGSHIYLAGCVEDREERNRIVLMRFDRDGRLDSGFGHGGRLTAPYSRGAIPRLIAPGRDGVLVVVDIGPRPLLTFSASGKVRRRSPGSKLEFVREVRGSVSGSRLILAWSHPIMESQTETSYIFERPLNP
jgi:uncharacterized delta-60 repeat protein